MLRIRIAWAFLALYTILFLPGCPGTPAKTPVLVSFSQADSPGAWTVVGPNASGSYSVLPLLKPQGIRATFKLVVDAPWPTSLRVTSVDPATNTSIELPKLESGSPGQDTGYYMVDNIDVNNHTPPRWNLTVGLPHSFELKTIFHVKIFDDSPNPQGESSPLDIPLDIERPNYTLTVTVQGPGHVQSNPNGILCGTSPSGNVLSPCTFTFQTLASPPPVPFPVVPVELDPNSNDGNSDSFAGWTGACTGKVCTVILVGSPMSAKAIFGKSAVVPPAVTCPAINPPTGTSGFSSTPSCQIFNIYKDPSPDLECNSQKYFCCADNPGHNDPDCGPDHSEFDFSCSPGEVKTLSGCYK